MAPPKIEKELPPQVKILVDEGVPAIVPRKSDEDLLTEAKKSLVPAGIYPVTGESRSNQ